MRKVQWAIQQAARALGYKVDSTADLARVMRVPGTFNYKRGGKRPVVIEHFPLGAGDRCYEVSDFDHLPEPPERQPRSRPWEGRAAANRADGEDSQRPAALQPIWDGCSWLRFCWEMREVLSEPDWYALLTILILCFMLDADGNEINGRDLCHMAS